jgi:tetratricopeptide (TPR) repeat protein
LAQQGKFREAADSFRQALRIDPTLAIAHFRLGVVLLDLGELDDAETHLAEAVRLDPDDPKAHCSLAAALAQRGKLAQAVVQYRRALDEDPDSLMALLSLASTLATSDDPAVRDGEQAVALATRACKLTRFGHPEALHVLGAAYAEVGRFAEAISAAELALRAALAAGNERLAEAIREPLKLYQQGKPLRANSR